MKRYAMETVVGIFVLIGIVCVGYMTIKLGKVQIFGGNEYPLSARFTSVAGLRVGSPVEIFGINVGRVDKLYLDQNREMAVVRMEIKNGMKVYDDGSATIKTSGLIGDKYVRIDPGGAGELLKPGSWITETSAPLDIEDLIGKFAFGNLGSKKSSAKHNSLQ